MRFNLPIAFASLLLSIMLWFVVYVQNVPEPDTLTAQLVLDGLDESRYFVRNSPIDVRLMVNGPSDRLKEMREETLTAYVDLSQPKTGTHDYVINLAPAWISRYLIRARPTARIEIEPVTERTMTVSHMVKGSLRDPSLQITNQTYSPKEVVVKGPKSEVDSVKEVRSYFDLSKVDPLEPSAQVSDIVPIDHRDERPPHVRTTPPMVVNSFKIVVPPSTKPALVVLDSEVTYDPSVKAGGYRVSPTTVTLKGNPALLTNVSKVPTDLLRVRDLDRTRTYRVRLLPPAGTTIVGPKEVDVTLLVRPVAPERPTPPRSEPSPETNR